VVTHTTQHRVAWGETDAAAIVFYPNYFRWFDQSTHDLLRERGYPVAEMMAEGFAVPLVEAQARFLAALAYGDELALTSTVSDVRTRTFRVDHRLYRGDVLVCEGYEVRIWTGFNPDGTLKPGPIPARLRSLLTADL
jgi:4-hydroxybenzoyl-CoA thioesterase